MIARRYRLAYFAIAVVFVVFVSAAVLTFSRLGKIESNAERSACSDRLTADVLAAAGRALAAPPAPNPARDAAVADIVRASDRLTHSDAVCAHGVPKPLDRSVTP